MASAQELGRFHVMSDAAKDTTRKGPMSVARG
jgi:hypothetical protein